MQQRKTNKLAILAGLALAAGDMAQAVDYCPVAGNGNGWIQEVAFRSLYAPPVRKVSGNNGGYFEGTDVYALGPNSHLTLTGSTAGYWQVWLDSNQDGIFSDSEKIFSQPGGSSALVPVPFSDGMPSGISRLRIGFSRFGFQPACGRMGSGETEDYAVTMQPLSDEAPTLYSHLPLGNNVATNSEIRISANLPLDGSTISLANFTLSLDGQLVPGQIIPIADNPNTYVFRPLQALLAGAPYTATVAHTIRGRNGKELAQDYSWSFTTALPAAALPPPCRRPFKAAHRLRAIPTPPFTIASSWFFLTRCKPAPLPPARLNCLAAQHRWLIPSRCRAMAQR